MITDEKLTVYRRYGGDIDGWVRAGTPTERSLMSYEDWATIDELLHRIAIVKSGQAAISFEAETLRMIDGKVEDKRVAKRLLECLAAEPVSMICQHRGDSFTRHCPPRRTPQTNEDK